MAKEFSFDGELVDLEELRRNPDLRGPGYDTPEAKRLRSMTDDVYILNVYPFPLRQGLITYQPKKV